MIRAITLDLDDTLWPVLPAIERAEQAVHSWLMQHAPATARGHTPARLRVLRERLAEGRPDLRHDVSAMRRESIRGALAASGDDPALAEAAFEVFFEARQRVDLFDDVVPVLEHLAGRVPLVAVTNGNADLERIGISHLFRRVLSPQNFGVGKPDRRIFLAACESAGVAPSETLHVGDDFHLDVLAARQAGLHAAWLRRPQLAGVTRTACPQDVHLLPDLRTLADLLAASTHGNTT